MKSWTVLALVAAVAYGRVAEAGSTCADQLAAYDKWFAPIKADLDKGAVSSDRVERLVAIPLRAGSPPKQSAMTLVVDKDGLHDGSGPATKVSQAKTLIAENRNLVFAKTNKNAISHGILVFATADAPAASVRAAVAAAVASKESVWLVFRPSDGKAAAPATSAVTKEIDKIDSKDIGTLVKVVQREFGKCSGLMDMMQELSSESELSRLALLASAPHAALEKCACKTEPAVTASLLWKIIFSNLAVVVPVPATGADALAWGDAKATWKDAAPAIVKALAK